jgi:EAL domain-containing protein (putative c-di-GMP-specific phosphodiesterase class I)
VVHAIVTLARNLGMKLIAEGVETNDQVTMLQALDCDLAQGYFFGAPTDAAAAEEFLIKSISPAIAA